MAAERKPASEHTTAQNLAAAAVLPESGEDFAEARRGLIAPFEPARIENEDGRTVWELETYDFLGAEPPATAHPSLWRQSRLSRVAGLFELAPGFYQRTARRASCRPTHSSSSATAPRTQPGATSS